jgi:DNA mismatch endonuclease (patch repair protein)
MGGRRCTPTFVGLRPASESASRAKRANRKTDTRPEVLLRRQVWRLGLRYRKHVRGLPGNPDLVFSAARVAVFCDGDFWHGREWKRLRSQLARRHNAAYWIAKIARNRERDREQGAALAAEGWLVVRLWESEVLRDPAAAASRVALAVRARLTRDGGPEQSAL